MKASLLRKFAFLIVLSAGAAVSAAVPPDISFSFENGPGSDKNIRLCGGVKSAGLKAFPRKSCNDPGDLTAAGLSGKALRVGNHSGKKGHDTVSYYVRKGIVSSKQGSFSFWMKAVDWNRNNRKNHVFLRLQTPAQESLVAVAQNMRGNYTVNLLQGTLKPGSRSTRVSGIRSAWRMGEWHHVAAAWGQGKFSLYLDGEFVGTRNYSPLKGDFSNLSLGEKWDPEPGCTLMDDLRFWQKTLSDKEIRREFERSAAKAAGDRREQEVAVARRTPVLDGVIGKDEYASSFAFMHTSIKKKKGLYSELQTRCFLAWDEKYLYCAAESDGSSLRNLIKDRDGNVWEDDSVEFFLTRFPAKGDVLHFIINPGGVYYDALYKTGKEDPRWNVKGMKIKSAVRNGRWILEFAVPWSSVGISPKNGENVYFNFCRAFKGDKKMDFAGDPDLDTSKKKDVTLKITTKLSAYSFFREDRYAKLIFAGNAPRFALKPLGLLTDGKISSSLEITSPAAEQITLDVIAGEKNPFRFSKTVSLQPGKTAVIPFAGNCSNNGTLSVTLAGKKSGKLLSCVSDYRKPTLLKYNHHRADREKMQMLFVVEGGDNSGELCGVTVKFRDKTTKKIVYTRTQKFPVRRGLITLRFDVKPLPPGLYDVIYEFSDAGGSVLHSDYEYFAKPDGKTPWSGTQAGLGDIVPPPWTPVAADSGRFDCWGKVYRIGGKGLITSVCSQKKELLARPMTLILNGKPLDFTSKLIKKGKSFADYRLTAGGSIPLTVDVRAEFDGLLWFTARVGKKGVKINSLKLEYPFNRIYSHVFDDCSSIYEKVSFKDWKNKSIWNDPHQKPFFWVGGPDVGAMGGIESCFGWYLKNRKQGAKFHTTPDEAVVTLNLIDTPLTLDASRQIEFYLHATPAKTKPRKAYNLRKYPVTFRYQSYFYEWKAPGQLDPTWFKYFTRSLPDKKNIDWYHYFSSKGASPLFPWWAWCGSDWNMYGNSAVFQQDMPADTRFKRDYGIWAWTCCNSRDYMDFKLDQIRWFLFEEKNYNCKYVYFDLAWPTCCRNPEHGCKGTDEFGRDMFRYDMRNLRELHKRTYIMMKQKTPDAEMLGHVRFSRTPSDVFFGRLTVGESYERMLAEKHNYYDVFEPEVMRILYGYRSNEYFITLGPQIYRTIQVYSRNMLNKMDWRSPEISRAQKHYMAYVKCHGFDHGLYNRKGEPLLLQLHEELESFGDTPEFYPYWKSGCGLAAKEPHPRFIYGAYAANGKVLLIVLNDTDKPVRKSVVVDRKKLDLFSGIGKDIFTGETYQVKNGTVSFDLAPRDSRFVMFQK